MYLDKDELEARLGSGALVLEIGSWEDVFPRADWILDINPYDTRKNGSGRPERFSRDSWVVGDVNRAEAWAGFSDKQFDFVICSHLLEDVRDPLYVARQLNRVAKAGYIEVPTRFRECARTDPLETGAGFEHHRWIVEVIDGELAFTPKLHWAHTLDYLPADKRPFLVHYKMQFEAIFWEGSFNYYERFPKGEVYEGANLLHYYDTIDPPTFSNQHRIVDGLAGARTPTGGLLWVDQFQLAVERAGEERFRHYVAQYEQRVPAEGRRVTRYNVADAPRPGLWRRLLGR